ncbi:hypothetical protein VTK56DRAFT_5184 [Thermocarpiscus australiensis]
MAASRRGQPPLSVRLPQPSSSAVSLDLPPVSALFLIDFDVKAGYTIGWKRAVPGLELEGAVEYKSLPSGLHTVPDDLVYFVHNGSHAGLSAFVNTPTDEEETRHARMIAVGVLVPLSYGRLGRAWRHAGRLKGIASKLAADPKQTHLLEEYWDNNGESGTSTARPLRDPALDSPVFSLKSSRPGLGEWHPRRLSASDGAALIPAGNKLSSFHPAWSLTSLLDTFGPLIFPIYRAALLRKRILISCHAPVHEVCNYVYDISVLSNIPLSVCNILDPSAPSYRLRPLFTVGVHDIAYLSQRAAPKRAGTGDNHDDRDDGGSGWVACTTDSILAVKEGLWDMLITMPPPYSSNAKQRVWPTVECPKGVPVKATQRDLRRFRSLSVGLARLAAAHTQSPSPRSPRSETGDFSAQTTPAIRLAKSSTPSRSRTATHERPAALSLGGVGGGGGGGDETDKIVEPTTWAALAYNGFMWWASAGEKRHGDEVDEQSHDAGLLADLAPPLPSPVLAAPSSQRARRRASLSVAGGTVMAADSRAGGTEGVDDGGGDHHDGAAADGDGDSDSEGQARVELAVVAYFHRLTASMLSVLADLVDSSEDDDMLGVDVDVDVDVDADADAEFERAAARSSGDDDDAQPLLDNARGDGCSRGWVRVDSDALAHMGLDVWSQADADFVKELAARYFSRRAYVETKGVEVCGVRVC